MERKSYYKAFVAQSPEEVLESVHKKDNAVLIAVTLSNGTYLEGFIIDIKRENNHQQTICMLLPDERVSFFKAHAIEVVTVMQPKKMVVELSKGAISRPLSTDNNELTVLQLKRWLNIEKGQLGSQIKELDINSLVLNELNNRLNVKDVVKALQLVVKEVIKDQLGQTAWQSINTIVLKEAETLNLQITEKTLTISIAINRALPKKLSNILEEKLLQIL
jgi:hypothetical protein